MPIICREKEREGYMNVYIMKYIVVLTQAPSTNRFHGILPYRTLLVKIVPSSSY